MSCNVFALINRKFSEYYSNSKSTPEDLLKLEKLFTEPNKYDINMIHSCPGNHNLLHLLYNYDYNHLKKKEDIAKMLIRLGININHKSSNGVLPVHYLTKQMRTAQNYDNVKLFDLMLPNINNQYLNIMYNHCTIYGNISETNCNKLEYYFVICKKGASINYFKPLLHPILFNKLEKMINEFEFQSKNPIDNMITEYSKSKNDLLKEKNNCTNLEKEITNFENNLNQKKKEHEQRKTEIEQNGVKLQQMKEELNKKQIEYQENEEKTLSKLNTNLFNELFKNVKTYENNQKKELLQLLISDLEINDVLNVLSEIIKNKPNNPVIPVSNNPVSNNPVSNNSVSNNPVSNNSVSNNSTPSDD